MARLGLPDNETVSRADQAMKEASRAARAAAADSVTKNVAAEARKAEFKHKNAAVHTARLDATAAVDKAADADDDDIGTYDDELLHYIQKTVRPLQLNRSDLTSIHRRFGLYTENFPPDTNGRKQFIADAETWQTYRDLQFSRFPLYFVEDENETACS